MSRSTSRQLARLLDAPHLERVVPGLAPEALHHIIQHCGLEACADLVALATPAQLTSVFDLDLWRHAEPGRDEEFDAIRFGEWLEVLTDADASLAARVVAGLDRHLVIAGLSRFVRVFDPAAVGPFVSLDGELVNAESALPAGVEIGGYRVTATLTASWDAILALLIALDAAHPICFHAVMRGCRKLSHSRPERDGLDDLLTAPDQLMSDVASDRAVRRSRQGYGTAAEARAFLQMARARPRPGERSPIVNPIAEAYFRAADEGDGPLESRADLSPRGEIAAAPADTDIAEALDAVAELLEDADASPDRPRALLEGAGGSSGRLAHVRALLDHLSQTDHASYHARTRELAFLANTLVAGCSFRARTFTPSEASAAAVAVCNLGLERWSERSRALSPEPAPSQPDMVTAFERGWATLHDDVSMFAMSRLIDVLSGVHAGDTKTHASLLALRRELAAQRASGTPWKVRDALDVLAVLDVPAWTGLLGLIDECPVMPAVVDAIVEGRAGAISATDFTFISTAEQITRVRAFVARLPELLGS